MMYNSYYDDQKRLHRLDGPAYCSGSGNLYQWYYYGRCIVSVRRFIFNDIEKIYVYHFYKGNDKEFLNDIHDMNQAIEYCQNIFNKVIKLKVFL